jgi:multiple antibiotic resistance protein
VDSLLQYSALAFGSLFAVLNPIATIPPFVAMTERNSAAERAQMARRACGIACFIAVLFSLTGIQVLSFFGVSMHAFQIAGGLVLIRVALDLIQGGRTLKVTPEERQEGVDKDDISVTPLGVPILCGPATIATGVLLSSKAQGLMHIAALVGIIVMIYAFMLVILVLAASHADRLGPTPIRVSSRLMGLILVAVAVEFMLEGLSASELLG